MTWKWNLPWSLAIPPPCFHVPSVWLPYCRTSGAIHVTAWIPGLHGVVHCTAAEAVGAGLDSSVSSMNTSCILTPPCFCPRSSLCLYGFSLFSYWGALVFFQGQLEPFLSLRTPAWLSLFAEFIPYPPLIASVTLLLSSLFTHLCSPLDCVFLKNHDLVFVICQFPEPQ